MSTQSTVPVNKSVDPLKVAEKQNKEVTYPYTVKEKYVLKYNVQSILPKQIIDGIVQTYSPGFLNGMPAVNKGISWDEQLQFMPTLLGMSATAPEFMSEIDEYFYNFTVEIPFNGKEVDASYSMVSPTVKLPVNIEDYILLAMLRADSTCCKDVANEAFGLMPYILEDLQVNKDLELKKFNTEMEANKVIEKLSNDEETTNLRSIAMHFITDQNLSITEIYNATKLDLLIIVRKASKTNPKQVIDLYKQEYLKVFADIEEGIAIGVITLDGEAYYYKTHK
jgi:hypothetical protein